MGLIYSAIKGNKPEAWEIGKNYYQLQDLFPACRFNVYVYTLRKGVDPNGAGALKFAAINAISSMLPPRWEPGQPNPFVLSELYPTTNDLISKIEELTGNTITVFERPHWIDFHRWAGDDPIMIMAEIDDGDPDEPEKFCGPLKDYRFMDSWNGEAGRRVGNIHEELEEESEHD